MISCPSRGTARVVAIDPLQIDLRRVASHSTGQVAIEGILMVRHETWTESCFQ